jgi:hypothetical protein
VRREFFPDENNKVQVRKVHVNTLESHWSLFQRAGWKNRPSTISARN